VPVVVLVTTLASGCGDTADRQPPSPDPTASSTPSVPADTPPPLGRLAAQTAQDPLPDCDDATVVGTAGDDVLRGTAGDDVIDGRGGDDDLRGGGGDDVLCGGGGRDLLVGGDGDDVLLGGADGDTLDGGLGDDTFVGGTDPRSPHEDGSDVVTFEHSESGVVVDLTAHAAHGQGNDRFADQVWSVTGSRHDDILVGSDRADTLRGYQGSDVVYGLGGDDVLDGNGWSPGDENLLAVADGDDVVVGGAGDDQVEDEIGSDHLSGGPGDDHLEDSSPGRGPNWLFGGRGDDILVIDKGTPGDHVDGGPGKDGYSVDEQATSLVRVEHDCATAPRCDT
jgi:Ca2+-binding RTX toxin-like protein